MCNSLDFKFKGGDIKNFQRKLVSLVKNREKLNDFWNHYNEPTTMEKHIDELYNYYGLKENK